MLNQKCVNELLTACYDKQPPKSIKNIKIKANPPRDALLSNIWLIDDPHDVIFEGIWEAYAK